MPVLVRRPGIALRVNRRTAELKNSEEKPGLPEFFS